MTTQRLSSGVVLAPSVGYRDQLVPGAAAGAGATAPNFGNLTGALAFWRGYSMAATGIDELHVLFHPNHDYRPNSPINFHVHWTPTNANAGSVVFGFEYSYARGYGVDAFGASSTVRVTQDAGGVALQHQIAETADVTIPNLETDGLILVRFFRDADDAADTYGSPVNVLTIDMHYQCDRFSTSARNRGAGWDP